MKIVKHWNGRRRVKGTNTKIEAFPRSTKEFAHKDSDLRQAWKNSPILKKKNIHLYNSNNCLDVDVVSIERFSFLTFQLDRWPSDSPSNNVAGFKIEKAS